MTFEIRELTADDYDTFRQAIASGFGHDVDLDDEAGAERFRAIFRPERAFPVFVDDEIIATGADFAFETSVPGGSSAAMAGLTIITVRPTHTRRGVLTTMMHEHFRRARERGEILGGLWASEATIYGRFGYGPATKHHEVKFDARYTGRGGVEPGVSVRLLDKSEAEQILPEVYAATQPYRPGVFKRTEDWWKYRLFYDPEKGRDGASALRHVVAEADGEPVGYASYRQKGNWDLLSEGEIRIRELVPLTDGGYRALWYYLTDIDLFPIVKHWNMTPDDPLPMLLKDGRAMATTSVSDALWVRLIDVPAALSARGYGHDGSIVMQIGDNFCDWNDGIYRLTVDEGEVTCKRVAENPDVVMNASALASLYLGGFDARALARVGRIDGEPSTIGLLNSMFRNSPEPWCAEIF